MMAGDFTKVLNVAIKPKPKPRPRFSRNGHAYTDPKGFEFEQAIRAAWVARYGLSYSTFVCPIEVSIEFEWEPGKTIRKQIAKTETQARESVQQQKGDLDNLEKAVLDALNGVAYYDDRFIIRKHSEKLPETPFSQNVIRISVTYLQERKCNVWQ